MGKLSFRYPKHICAHDRIVFLGDSITEQQLYTNYVEAYLVSRYPELDLTFINAGWGGDTASGGLRRLERDVLFCKPTLVTICYGMNDGRYQKLTDEIREEFAASMRGLVGRLKASGVRIVLLTPGFAEEKADKNLRAIRYSRVTLRTLADEVLKIAAEESVPAFDLHTLMTDVDRRIRMAGSSIRLTMEGIHPNQCGHLVMAFGLLRALGVPPCGHDVSIDYRRWKAKGSLGVSATITRNDDRAQIEVRLPWLPFFIEEAARPVLSFLPFEEMYNNLYVKINGVGKRSCSLRVRGLQNFGDIEGARLRRGVNVLAMPRPGEGGYLPWGEKILRITNEKTQTYFRLWRNIALDATPKIDGHYYDRASHELGLRLSKRLEKVRAKCVASASPTINITFRGRPLSTHELDNGDFITEWSLTGPYRRPFDVDHLRGEATFSASPPKLNKRWIRRSIDPSTFPDCLRGIFGDREFCVCYAVTIIDSPVDQDCELLVGSDDGVAVWLNGDMLESNLMLGRAFMPDADRIPARLRKGSNVLLLKISQYLGPWGFSARFDGLSHVVKMLPLPR